MDAMGLSNKKSHTVSTSHSGSFTHNPAESPKTPGIVSRIFWLTWHFLNIYASKNLDELDCPLLFSMIGK